MLTHHDEKAEQAVLGSLIMAPRETFGIIMDCKIGNEHFFSPLAGRIFDLIQEIGETCDLVQVSDAMAKAGLKSAHDVAFLDECVDNSFPSHLQYHCEILTDKLHRRQIVTAANEAIQACGEDSKPIDIVANLGAVAVDVADAGDTISKAQIVEESLKIFDNAHNGVVTGVPLPWKNFSQKVGGIQKRCICPLLGRDGSGKSFLVSKFLTYLGRRGIPALSIPFEDGADRQMRRMAGCCGRYSAGDLERGYYKNTDGAFHKMDDIMFARRKAEAEQCLREVEAMPIYFEDASMTVEQIRVLAGIHKRKYGIEILLIDGVKDVVPSKGENATKQEEHISRVLVQTAKELDIAIVPVSHLTDIPEDVKIQRRNMRGAKTQFHNARQVMIFQNAGLESGQHFIGKNTVALHMEKNNYGRESMLFLETDFDHCDFTETPSSSNWSGR